MRGEGVAEVWCDERDDDCRKEREEKMCQWEARL